MEPQKKKNLRQRLGSRPLLLHLALALATLVVLAVAAHLLMLAGTRHGARRTVPDFSGLSLAEAERTARDRDLVLVVNDSLYVAERDGGVVLDQLPQGGTEVKPGRTVYLTVNAFRKRRVRVPYVAGRSLRQARNMLETAGLEIERLVYEADLATNYVLAEYCRGEEVTPESRIETETGSGITLHVGVEGGYGTTVVPGVVGRSLDEAKGRLWEQGINVGRVEFDDPDERSGALVYLQSPVQEQTVALGSHVDLRLTTDTERALQARAEAEREAQLLLEERLAREAAEADSLTRLEIERALTAPADTLPVEKYPYDPTADDTSAAASRPEEAQPEETRSHRDAPRFRMPQERAVPESTPGNAEDETDEFFF